MNVNGGMSIRKFLESQTKVAADHLKRLILAANDTGMEKKFFSDSKGYGIIAVKTYYRGDFVVEYRGKVLKTRVAIKKRHQRYNNMETEVGSYMFEFQFKNVHYCIDATVDNDSFGRLINHSKKHPNLVPRIIEVEKEPRLCLFASRDIQKGEELLYDYGERSKEAMKNHEFLKE